MTVGQYLEFLLGKPFNPAELTWPADVFGLAAAVLKRSGAYVELVHEWPPKRFAPNLGGWEKFCARQANLWREAVNGGGRPPPEVQSLLEEASSRSSTTIHAVANDPHLVSTFLQLLLIADTVFEGQFVPGSFETTLQLKANLWLSVHGWLNSPLLPPARLRVLPKYATPPVGMFPRSLSSNLSLCEGSEANIHFHSWVVPESPAVGEFLILAVPFPYRVDVAQFSRDPYPLTHHKVPNHFDYFRYTPTDLHGRWGAAERSEFALWVGGLVKAAEEQDRADGRGRQVWGVVFPEGAFSKETADEIGSMLRKSFLLAGVGAPGNGAGWDFNAAYCRLPGKKRDVKFEQHKAHRWKLDKSQIGRYALESQFYTSQHQGDEEFWEGISLRGRGLYMIDLAGQFTFSIAICEDLARLEPNSEVLRAVAPHLLIALLNDGPQLDGRWSSKYALTYAEDPGTSVMTLTSLGMSRQSGCGHDVYCNVGLWRDPQAGMHSITLGDGDHAVALPVRLTTRDEFRADGSPAPRKVLELETVPAKDPKDPPAAALLRLHRPPPRFVRV